MNNTNTKAVKSTLSRLLAGENIFVVHDVKAETASFDVKSRVLTLPVLKDITDEMYDMFIGHEVSHALHTPFTDADRECLKNHNCLSPAYEIADGDEDFFRLAHTYINIVEDARIERLIKDRYAGLRRDFYVGYGELFKRNFFGTQGKDINEYSFIDRINLHFKIGSHIHVPFTDEEMEFVHMVDTTRSFDDVVDVTKKIWAYVKKKKADEMELSHTYIDIDVDVDVDGDVDGEATDVDGNANSNGKSNNNSGKGKVSNNNGYGNWSNKSLMPDDCQTQQNFDAMLKKSMSKNINDEHNYYTLPSVNMQNVCIPYKKVLDKFNDVAILDSAVYNNLQEDADKFITDSNRVVNILVQAFHAKKAARDHQRSMVHRTGVIDTVRMMDYKFNDDIFRRMKTVPKGKSHGLIFFMDLSGSMSPIIDDTFKQLIQLVLFCKRVNIPFEVYGFSTKCDDGTEFGDRYSVTDGDYMKNLTERCWTFKDCPYGSTTSSDSPVYPFTLINIFSSKMNKIEISQMVRNLFACGTYYKRNGVRANVIPHMMHLSSTPLIETIVAAMDIVPHFKGMNKLDIVHTVFLTDGEPTGVNMRSHNSHYTKGNFTFDSITPKAGEGCTIENNMIRMFKEYTGSKAICFFLCDSKTSLPPWTYAGNVYYSKYNGVFVGDGNKIYADASHTYCKEGWALADPDGNPYDGKFIIRANNSVDNADLEDTLSTRTSNVGIRNAFVKAMNSTMVSRVMLNRFIDLIATE